MPRTIEEGCLIWNVWFHGKFIEWHVALSLGEPANWVCPRREGSRVGATREDRRREGGCVRCRAFGEAAPHGRWWLRWVKYSRGGRRGRGGATQDGRRVHWRPCGRRREWFRA